MLTTVTSANVAKQKSDASTLAQEALLKRNKRGDLAEMVSQLPESTIPDAPALDVAKIEAMMARWATYGEGWTAYDAKYSRSHAKDFAPVLDAERLQSKIDRYDFFVERLQAIFDNAVG